MAHPAGKGLGRSTGQKLIVASGVVLAFCLLVGAGLFWIVSSKLNSFDRVKVNVADAAGGPENYLLVGSDSRASVDPREQDAGAFLGGETAAGKRSDTVIVARVDPKSQQIALLSIPRDLYLPIGSATGEKDRINTAYADGPQVLIDTITSSLGIPVNHYVEVDFGGFRGLVDVLGGVPIYISQPMRDEWTGLQIPQAGCVVLKGDQALAFARSRHLEVYDGSQWVTDPTSDLGRMSRQQLFLRKAMDKGKGLGLTDLLKVNRLVDVASKNVSFDPGLSITRAVSIVRRFSGSGGNAMTTYSLPTVPFTTDAGAEVLDLVQSEAQPILDIFTGHAPMPGQAPADAGKDATSSTLHPSKVSVRVLNGTGIDGQAGQVAGGLQEYGFVVTEVGDAGTAAQTRTTLRFGPGNRPLAELVAKELKGSVQLKEDAASGPSVVLVTGADFGGVIPAPAAASTTAAPTTTVPPAPSTTVVGFTPTEPPPGTSCG
ncbi:MAG: hypothetical protein QOJ19_3293 [Acidimicrobiia bacterium]|nr:hypothetical protein [Acidimicrobiia bacterium]